MIRLPRRFLFLACHTPLLIALAAARPASALTIIPLFDISITGAANAAQLEGAISDAAGVISSLYTNAGSVRIVFSQAAGSFLGESQSASYGLSYAAYTADLTSTSKSEPGNVILTSAVANLASGNKPGTGGSVIMTSADGRIALGLARDTPCFSSSGTYVNSCNQAYDGVVTISTSYTLNYGKTAVAGQYSAVDTVEHEVNEVLGGGGQGSVLNAIADNIAAYQDDVGVLDPYRYLAPGVPSFSTAGSASGYFSIDGGQTNIVFFNQNSSGDYGDFNTSDNVQSAFSGPGILATYDTASPEFAMLESIGYAGVPEPGSFSLVAVGLASLGWLRRRDAGPKAGRFAADLA